jgi:hypothetical protein
MNRKTRRSEGGKVMSTSSSDLLILLFKSLLHERDNARRAWERPGVRRFGWVVVLAFATLPRPLFAEGTQLDVREGTAARATTPPDNEVARAAFERAASSSEADVAAIGLFFLGEMDEEAMRFSDAAASYDASLARLPSNRYALRAASRSSAIKSHSEGDYAPLTRLETVRRDPTLANDPAAIDALVKDAESFPSGPVRVEARLLAAEAYRGRLARPRDQLALLWLVVRDPRADVIASREAAVEIVQAEIHLGNVDAAARAAAELGPKLDAHHRDIVKRLLRRRVAHAAATGELALFVVLLAVAVARGGAGTAARAAGRVLPTAALFCAFATAVGGLLASSYETGSATPLLMVAPAMLTSILLARAWSAVGSKALAARALRAAMCASSLVAATLLLMERLTPEYLEGFGL